MIFKKFYAFYSFLNEFIEEGGFPVANRNKAALVIIFFLF